MKIALLGYGKMGHEIGKIALEQGHEIAITIDNENDWQQKGAQLRNCDVAIEFSMPSIVIQNIRKCFEVKIPVVVGTTGWYAQLDAITAECISTGNALFYATNFSIGVNIFAAINRKLSALLKDYPMYTPSLVEIHHTQKLDAPSGTAITLANELVEANARYRKYTTEKPANDEVQVQSIREGNVPGTHTVTWKSDIDQISITHEAFNRRGFAIGAITAATWLQGQKGVFTMKHLLNL